MGVLAGIGWQWINLAFLAGGLFLVVQKICDWVMPLAFLLTLVVLSTVFYDSGSSNSLGSPLFHLFSGATMLGAFFILTDPVTSPDQVPAKIVFAVGVGILTFLIRAIGAYPEGFAFAILLMNTCVPLLEQTGRRF